jgi:hypothetical protein
MKGVIYMDTENKNVELDEQTGLFEDEVEPQIEPEVKDDLKDAIEETLSKIRRQSMLLGFQVACQSVLDKITAFERKPGSKSNNDHKRLIKDIKQFVEQGLSRKVNTDGETEPETVQN